MRKRLSLVLLALVGAIAVVVVAAIALGAGEKTTAAVPKSILACAQCHSMEQEVSQWAASVHADLTCLECHVDFETEWVREKLNAHTQETAVSSNIHPGIELKADLSRCETCHQPQMEHLMKDLIPPELGPDGKAKAGAGTGQPMAVNVAHEKHLNGSANLECVTCHLSEVHGPAAGTQQRQEETHQLCTACHTQKGVQLAVRGDVSCTACHTDLAAVTPADHKNPVLWKQAHGKASTTQSCGECHLSTSAGPHGTLADPANFTSASGDACMACHAGIPMPHPSNFVSRHGQEAVSAKPGSCESCHSDKTGSTAPASVGEGGPQFCSECHAKPMPHPSNYLGVHGTEAQQSPATCEACHSRKNPVNPTASHADQAYCSTCHDAYQHPLGWAAGHGTRVTESCATCHSTAEEGGHNACVTCHDAYQHPQGWVAAHGDQVTVSCTTCHTTMEEQGTKNTCAECHSLKRNDGTWHDPMWFAKHGRQVEAEGSDSCLRCHSELEPSCSKCHADR